MRPARKVQESPSDVERRLYAMALTVANLREALLSGEIARANCSAFSPPSFPGTTAWAMTTVGLREQLVPLGWMPDDRGNYSVVVSPDGGFAIVVATGDENTGGPAERSPRTRSPKGPATAKAVETNEQQLSFLSALGVSSISGTRSGIVSDEEDDDLASTLKNRTRMTWVYLISRRAGVAYAELSLPLTTDNGHVTGWEERIVLPPIDLSDETLNPLVAPEPGPDFDVDVRRLQ